MMDSKATKLAAVLLCCLGLVALATSYTWTGDSQQCTQNENAVCLWGEQLNWDPTGYSCTPNCFPRTTDDDATIAEDVYNLTLDETLEIDDLGITMTGTPHRAIFLASGDGETVTCDTITISGATVSVTDLAGLKADGTEPCPET